MEHKAKIDCSRLDDVRFSWGSERLKSYYHEKLQSNAGAAAAMLNTDSISFPVLFTLKSEIKKFNILNSLEPRSRFAVEIAELMTAKNTEEIDRLVAEQKPISMPVLKWMLTTGCKEENMGSAFDNILDMVSTILILTFKQFSLLGIIIDLIFRRHRRGAFIYDLVWAVFESRSPDILSIIAQYLKSGFSSDAALARKILGFIPCIGEEQRTVDSGEVLRWIDENYQFLCYTGESFQQTGTPRQITVSLESKYLCRPILIRDGQPAKHMTRQEWSHAIDFGRADDETKELLARHSYRLYHQNPGKWSEWINSPISHQIRTATESSGVAL